MNQNKIPINVCHRQLMTMVFDSVPLNTNPAIAVKCKSYLLQQP